MALKSKADAAAVARTRVTATGAVQGVGMRPFVHRLATDAELAGFVCNTPRGITIEVEGPTHRLRRFVTRLQEELPSPGRIDALETLAVTPDNDRDFEIRSSAGDGPIEASVLPDLAVCAACIDEFTNPADRRYRYPFINCTHCGPRASIIDTLPYDRPGTTMRAFTMCASCRSEYDDPRDRRFHAQPIACPECGPQLTLRGHDGSALATDDAALAATATLLRDGAVVAVKGLGGFHLMALATDEKAVSTLRERKSRPHKPLAVMFAHLEQLRAFASPTVAECELLSSMASPIVLVRKRRDNGALAASVAPDNAWVGAMLAYTPLHHLLLADVGAPLIATSGNRSGEPICADNEQALSRLSGIAEAFLEHDRPIAVPFDDSVVRMAAGRSLVLRLARGLAPVTLRTHWQSPNVLASGAHQKNAVALGTRSGVVVGPHNGDLDTVAARRGFEQRIQTLQHLYGQESKRVVCDRHPDYASTTYARQLDPDAHGVFHHEAHVLSCMADNALAAPVLGVAWDGSGFGGDAIVRGGEFFMVGETGCERVAHWRTFRLPGGERAAIEPRRAALGLLHGRGGEAQLRSATLAPVEDTADADLDVFVKMLERGTNAPFTTSVGRLFDAAASLLGLQQRCSFEGQAAIALESILDSSASKVGAYPVDVGAGQPAVVDWGPMLDALLADLADNVSATVIAARFHNTLAEAIVAVATRYPDLPVALSGGCFQNAYLTERTVDRLHAEGISVYWHRRIPPNDGGLALGQVLGFVRANGGAA